MRIRDLIRASNMVVKTGQNADAILYQMVAAIIDQIDVAAAQLSTDVTLH